MTFPILQLWCWLALFGVPANAAPPSAAQQETRRSPHGKLDIPCENCHTAAGWKPLRAALEFDHSKTKYPLRGMHENVKCTECHIKPVFTDVGKNCADCHADIHRRKFGPNCEQCHTVAGWNVTVQQVRQHDNRFPLLGAHAAVQCEDCHKGAAVGQYEGLSILCSSCHLRDFQNATSPSHTASSFPTTCDTCHNVDTWAGAKFDHLKQTGYALTGAHATLDCVACHVGGKYQGTPATCQGCHLPDWQKTTDPVHSAAGPDFAPANCANCHTTAGWAGANFNHSQFFPLTNSHAGLQCSQCHVPGAAYSAAPTTCQGCHMDKFNSAATPVNHVQAGFPPALCSTCHDTIAWADGKFDHTTMTTFPLTGLHIGVACSACHSSGVYKGLTTSCGASGCHLTTWQQTNNPVHSAAGPDFAAANCANCHTTSGWDTANFNHNQFFPLTNAHAGLQCVQCHVAGAAYSAAPTTCQGCHMANYNGAVSPINHVQLGFPPALCSTCHDTIAWTDGKFDHSTTTFPLTGAHLTTPCASCHINNNYSGTLPTDCYSCHLADWNSTQTLGGSVPNHIAAGYPTTCTSCHTTTSWLGATFNHTFFRIPHNGSVCSDCHQVPTDYSSFTCINCHTRSAHDQTSTNQIHQGNKSYSYGPTTCYNCHKG
ncbi:MAG TPA: hypothetical protein VE077_13460 [Candidatus Methylomirabilis sp.]|nr:hypothetical protein [Candidatus Methylomirabilis sp.]